MRGLAARASVAAIEREMAHFAEESSDERHAVHFLLCDEAIRDAETEHERQNVEIAGVVGDVNFGAGRVHVLLADDADAAAGQSEEDF